MEMFEKAVKGKYRFESTKGVLSTEDLFDLSVKDLDSVFKKLNSQLKQASEESLLVVKSRADEELDTKIEIVKHIVALKLEEQAQQVLAKQNKEQKQYILGLMAEKKNEQLKNLSLEQLEEMAKQL
jgi:hypothetical protein